MFTDVPLITFRFKPPSTSRYSHNYPCIDRRSATLLRAVTSKQSKLSIIYMNLPYVALSKF